MKYLLDTNLWVALLMEAPGHADVRRLLTEVHGRLMATTDFAIHSVGFLLARSHPEVFIELLDELVRNPVGVLHLAPPLLRNIPERMKLYDLDFDDAFQLLAAEYHDLQIVSFDADFDRTPRGRLTAQALESIAKLP